MTTLNLKTLRYELADGIGVVTFDEQGSPVNTMCEAWQADMVRLAEQVRADRARAVAAADGATGRASSGDPGLSLGLILTSAKSTFFAGADLRGLMNAPRVEPAAVFATVEGVKKSYRALETLGVPVVACLNGSALGGGWETALVAHHRIATRNPKSQFGTPEVNLGLIPGAGGLTKMSRLLGLQGAQPYIIECKLFGPEEGLKLGVIHEIVDGDADLLPRAKAWLAANAGKPEAAQHPWERKDWKMPGGDARSPKLAGLLSVAPAVLKQKTRGLYPAPEAALAAMVEGSVVDLETALRIESRWLAQMMSGSVARNMINTFFFNLNAVKSGASRPAGIPKFKPQRVGILGAGMMGSGIAYAQAARGIPTVLKDVSLEAAEKGRAYSLKVTQPKVDKGRMSAEQQAALLARIQATANAEDLRGCDLIIEAVYEKRDLKAQVTREAEPLLAEGGFFASNTSTLPISGLASASARPEKFIGIHFFSPVDKMQLVEIIRGHETDDETVARAIDYVLALGKLPVVVNDSRGFYTSRTFGTYVMEGAAMLHEGVPAALIENASMQAGMPVGPLAVIDETSLTLSVHVMEQTRADYAAEGRAHEAAPGEALIERMVKELKRGGRAAGGGFYDYPAGQKKHLWPQLRALFEKPGHGLSAQDVKDRVLYRQAVETARCLSEGVLTTVHEGNIASIFGIGYPGWTGGALQFIYGQGVENFVRRCDELAARFGPRFALSGEVAEALKLHMPRY